MAKSIRNEKIVSRLFTNEFFRENVYMGRWGYFLGGGNFFCPHGVAGALARRWALVRGWSSASASRRRDGRALLGDYFGRVAQHTRARARTHERTTFLLPVQKISALPGRSGPYGTAFTSTVPSSDIHRRIYFTPPAHTTVLHGRTVRPRSTWGVVIVTQYFCIFCWVEKSTKGTGTKNTTLIYLWKYFKSNNYTAQIRVGLLWRFLI